MSKENKKKFSKPGFYKTIVEKIKKVEPNYNSTQLAKDLRTEKKNLDNLDQCEPIYEKRFNTLFKQTIKLANDKKVEVNEEIALFDKQTLIDDEIVHDVHETLIDTDIQAINYKSAQAYDLLDRYSDHIPSQPMMGDDVNFQDLSIRGFMGTDEIFFSISKHIKISELENEKDLFKEICETMKKLNELSDKRGIINNNNTMHEDVSKAIAIRELEDKFTKSFESLLEKGISIFNYRFAYWKSGPDRNEFGELQHTYWSRTRDVFIFGKKKDRHFITFSEGDPPPEDSKEACDNTFINGLWYEEWYKKNGTKKGKIN